MSSNFLILSHARSGSTWLVNTLNNVAGILCYGELFRQKANYFEDGNIKKERFPLWQKSNPGLRPFSTYQYLESIIRPKEVTGFKLMYGQLFNYPELAIYIAMKGIRVIHLTRKNPLEAIISYEVAKQRGQFHYRGSETVPQEKPLMVNPDEVVRRIRSLHYRSRLAQRYLRTTKACIHVFYEDLVKDRIGFKPIWDLLGLDYEASPPQWQMKKGRANLLKDTVSNYAQLEKALFRAGYAPYLKDV